MSLQHCVNPGKFFFNSGLNSAKFRNFKDFNISVEKSHWICTEGAQCTVRVDWSSLWYDRKPLFSHHKTFVSRFCFLQQKCKNETDTDLVIQCEVWGLNCVPDGNTFTCFDNRSSRQRLFSHLSSVNSVASFSWLGAFSRERWPFESATPLGEQLASHP